MAVCHYQDDVEACKSVHVVGYANPNPNPTELLRRLATLFVNGHLVFGSLSFFGFGPIVITRRNLWNKPSHVVVIGCVETGLAGSASGRIERFSNDCRKTKTKAITPTNHNRNRQRDEPITIPSNYM